MTIETIIKADETGQELVDFAERTAESAARNGLKRAQIRRIFSEARLIDSMWEKDPQTAARRLTLLTPKLEYQAARDGSQGLKDVAKVLTEAIKLVGQAPDAEQRAKRFQRFMELFEAILAYHRVKGGN